MRYFPETLKKKSLFSYQFSESFSSNFARTVCQLSFEGTSVDHGCHTWGKTGIDYINVTDKSKMRHSNMLYNAHVCIVICNIKRLMTEVYVICLGFLFNMGGKVIFPFCIQCEWLKDGKWEEENSSTSHFVWSPIINEKTNCSALVCRIFLCAHWFMKILMLQTPEIYRRHCASGASLWTQR